MLRIPNEDRVPVTVVEVLPPVTHPLDPLTPEESSRAAALLRHAGLLGPGTLVSMVLLDLAAPDHCDRSSVEAAAA
jgi:hypothetical protein